MHLQCLLQCPQVCKRLSTTTTAHITTCRMIEAMVICKRLTISNNSYNQKQQTNWYSITRVNWVAEICNRNGPNNFPHNNSQSLTYPGPKCLNLQRSLHRLRCPRHIIYLHHNQFILDLMVQKKHLRKPNIWLGSLTSPFSHLSHLSKNLRNRNPKSRLC